MPTTFIRDSQWIAAADQTKWAPLWTPPRFQVANPAINARGARVEYLPYVIIKSDSQYCARVIVVIHGDFSSVSVCV
jgi:hypothetical protein